MASTTKALVVDLKAPHITKVLDDAQEDVGLAEFPGFAGKLFNPVRENMLLPMTQKAGEVLPAVADAIPLPFVDEIAAFAMSVPLACMKVGYSFIPHKEADEEANAIIKRDMSVAFGRSQRPKPFLSSMLGVVGFAANSIIDIVTLPFNGKLGDWIDATMKFLAYVVYSGIGPELGDAFFDPNAFGNMLIIGRIQKERNAIGENTSRRSRTAMTSLPPNVDESVWKNIVADSSRYVKYASAAYGVDMIDSADLLQVYGKKIVVAPCVRAASKKGRKRKIAQYINVKPEDIITISKPGGSMDILGHFITVDKKKNFLSETGSGAVVLAIRGTYTLSGIKVDLAGYSEDFCDGKAHAGIAKCADNLWTDAKETIVKTLLDNPGFDLVITGHSLGSGAAALLALKLKYTDALMKENVYLKDVKIRCFAFASPPVFWHKDENVKLTRAMKDTYTFIHEEDCVPFMSVDSVRKLADMMVDVDKYPKGLLFFDASPLMAAGLKPIPDDLKKIVYADKEPPSAPDAEKLGIPAPFIMWLRKSSEDNKGRPMYNTMFCRPKAKGRTIGVSDLNVQLTTEMISDHMNPQYERAIFSVRERMLHKQDGFVFPNNPEEVITAHSLGADVWR